uniref:Uncharacterized protein n=1 Tax=viral metagenome TaxID=1070528 RepID=A0A6H1ZG17_9ZZZZ
MKCELCNDTGWYGDNGPGTRGNREFVLCECKSRGYRIALYGDTATHAVCRCGIIAKINEDSHQCTWTHLVKV